MSKSAQAIDLKTLGEFALVAAKNARRLLDDAELLLKRGRWPTAYSLAVLAFEEAGKAWLCFLAMIAPRETREDMDVPAMIGAHLDKLMIAHIVAHMMAFIPGGDGAPERIIDVSNDLDELARVHNRAKQHGFYADLANGQIWDPAGVSKPEAVQMLATVRGLIDHGAPVEDAGFLDWVASDPDDMRAIMAAYWERFTEGWRAGGPEGMVTAVTSYMNEMGAIDGWQEMLRQQEAERRALAQATHRRAQPKRSPPRAKRRPR